VREGRMTILLTDALPNFASELQRLLTEGGYAELAQKVPELRIVERCRCGDDFCATFYTEPKPQGSYGAGHENVELEPERGMIILDVVNNRIMCVEVLDRDDVKDELLAAVL
jgi:hypothetical protein